MASPVKRPATSRSVVAAEAGAIPAAARAESSAIKARPARPRFLSCRGAVIVEPDNLRVEGIWTLSGAGHFPVKAAARIFQVQGWIHEFRITPCRGIVRSSAVLGGPGLSATGAAAAAARATQPRDVRGRRT